MAISVPSSLETTLAHGDVDFIVLFFRCWDPRSIFLLGRLNYRLRSIVHCYVRSVWDVATFLRPWFNPDLALRLLEAAPAIICGPSVVEFFDRCSPRRRSLDVCVAFGGLSEVGKFLSSHGYKFRSSNSSAFEVTVLLEAARFPESRHKVYGERSITQDEHGSQSFRFVRNVRGSVRVVVVHLVRCEFHRFVFAMHSTALMNYITARYAISAFPRSAFLKRTSFVSYQETPLGADGAMTQASRWLEQYTSYQGGFNYAKLQSGSKRFYMLPTAAKSAQGMWVTSRNAGCHFHDYDLAKVFPHGCISIRIDDVPGTDMRLPFPWRIYIDSGSHPAPMNDCIKRKYNFKWSGNVVVIKHRVGSDGVVTQVSIGEEAFADVVVGL
ncbi:hypothetical protein C8R44DRAFT_869290 [Mycena epipterygia]|nr:hypothetical protein C8R44DRAFT_869290 [Mycena epipterygia]